MPRSPTATSAPPSGRSPATAASWCPRIATRGGREERREQLRLRHLDLLRLAGRWSDVVDLDPADEPAHVALMRQYADAGDRHAAIRQYERLDRVLRRELGVTPERRGAGAA